MTCIATATGNAVGTTAGLATTTTSNTTNAANAANTANSAVTNAAAVVAGTILLTCESHNISTAFEQDMIVL